MYESLMCCYGYRKLFLKIYIQTHFNILIQNVYIYWISFFSEELLRHYMWTAPYTQALLTSLMTRIGQASNNSYIVLYKMEY